MAFDSLTNRLSDTFRKLRGKANLSEGNISEVIQEIRIALLEADVNLDVINVLLEHIKAETMGMDVVKGVDPSEMFVKVVYDKLVEILGNENEGLSFTKTTSHLLIKSLNL